MAGMSGNHGAATRLRHVANEKSWPSIKIARIGSKALKKIEQSGMAPVAVAREPHHLPVRTVDWKRDTSCEASSRVGTNRPRGKWSRRGMQNQTAHSLAAPLVQTWSLWARVKE